MNVNQILPLVGCGVVFFAQPLSAGQIVWKNYSSSLVNTDGKKLLYFQIPGSTLDLEFVENVLEDVRIQQIVETDFTPILLSAKNSDDLIHFREYGVYASPTLMILENGKPARTITRERNRESILAFLQGKEIQSAQGNNDRTTGTGSLPENVFTIKSAANHPEAPSFDMINWVVSQQENTISTTLTLAANVDPNGVARYMYFIDADGNANTGYTAGEIIGAEYMIQSDSLYSHSGAQSVWNWSVVTSAPYSYNNSNILHTITIPGLSGTPKGFWAMTQDANWQTIEVLSAKPTSQPKIQPSPAASQPATTSSYSAQQYFQDPLDSSVGAKLDLTNIHTAIVGDYLNVAVKFRNPFTVGTVQVFLDSDRNSRTGFSNADKSGADFMIEGLHLNQFKGSTYDEWKWEAVADLKQTMIENGVIYEIPRNRAGIQAGQPLPFWIFISGENWETVDSFPNAGVATFEMTRE